MNLTRIDLEKLLPGRQDLIGLFRFLHVLWLQVKRDKVLIRASGLAYSTLLAIVPLGAVVFALFSGFGAFDSLRQKVQAFLFSQLLPGANEELTGYIDHFINNTGNLGFVGFVGLIATSILLIDNIESNFNDVWQAHRRRRLVPRVTAYTSALVFGTVFIGLSVTISARVRAVWIGTTGLELPLITRMGAWLFPLVASFLAFLLMFLIIPFGRVKIRSAMVGALVTGIAWELSKALFALSVSESVRFSTIYGSLAAVPLFLIWLYITWMLILIGLEVAYAHQHLPTLVRARTGGDHNGREHLSSALKLLVLIARPFEDGDRPPTADQLADALALASGEVEMSLSRLTDAGLIHAVDGDSTEPGFVPAAPPNRIPASDAFAAVLGSTGEPSAAGPPLDQAVAEALSAFVVGGSEAVHDLTLADLVQKIS